MASLRLEGISKLYPGGAVGLRDLDLEVVDGELLVLVGPSGCGKSTALRLVAGLESPSAGRVWIGGEEVTHRPPRERDVAMVFQSYALYPHKSARENLAFGLRLRRLPRAEIARRVEAVARSLGIEACLDRRPAQLSGGQRQRVALGRALVREPRAFLLDEPLSNLDAALRLETRAELLRLHRRLRATMLYVTHDQEEAMTLGDRIAVLREGRLQQLGAPLEVYRQPANLFVAGFVGSPPMNLLPCSLEAAGAGLRLRAPGFALTLPGRWRPAGEAVLGVRPQELLLVAPGAGDADARVEVVESLGSELRVHARLEGGGGAVTLCAPAARPVVPDERVGLRLSPEALHLFDARSGARLAPAGEGGLSA